MVPMNFDIIKFDDYREVLRHFTKLKKISFRTIALDTKIHTSYFSRVMGGKAEFSEEQMHKIGTSLTFENWQMDYFLLLGSLSRNSCQDFCTTILQRINKIRHEKSKVMEKLRNVQQVKQAIDLNQYYTEAILAKLHMYLTLPEYRQDLPLLARKLFISPQKLDQEINKLEGLKIIRRQNDQIEILVDSLHLDENHIASSQNHKNWRIETLARLNQQGPDTDDYHLSAVFTCDQSTKTAIKETIREAIVKIQGLVSDAQNSNEVHHIGMDFF